MKPVTPDIKSMVDNLARSGFDGSIEIKLADGKIVLIRKTETYRPPMENLGNGYCKP